MDQPHSLHWGYAGANSAPAANWAPVTTRPVKRPLSESDECEDVFSEESSKEQCTSPGDADSCQMLSRKKRRGVIEKKRRDRINTSLSELKRLVPSAFEKQGSAKLEKAEILQMTVDHLKMLHAKGLDALAYDPHKYAMDYHNIGFRECATEVARYLVTIEGMDIQDPLRLRLMSHLQCFAAQRELATKQATSSPWGYGPSSQHYPPPPPPPPLNPITATSPSAPVASHPTNLISNLPHQAPPPPSLHHHHTNLHELSNHFDISTSCTQTIQTASDSARQAAVSQPASTSVLTPLTTATTTTATASTGFGYPHHQYSNLNAFSTPTSGNAGHHQNYNQGGNGSSQMKPYRPWGGAEVAY